MVFGPFVWSFGSKLMVSYHDIASRSCDTYVGEFSCSRSCDRPPPLLFYDFWISCVEFQNLCFTNFSDFHWYDLSIFVHWWIRVSLTCYEYKFWVWYPFWIFEKILVILINRLLIIIYILVVVCHYGYYTSMPYLSFFIMLSDIYS